MASLSLGSPSPNLLTWAGSPRYRPSKCPPTTGSTTPALADRPARLKDRVNANAVVLIAALPSSIGADGSNARSPQLKVFTAVTIFTPVAMGQYAPGSSSCADANAGSSTTSVAAAHEHVAAIRASRAITLETIRRPTSKSIGIPGTGQAADSDAIVQNSTGSP